MRVQSGRFAGRDELPFMFDSLSVGILAMSRNKVHPLRQDMEAYLLGTLPPEQAEPLALHLEQCSECSDTVADLEAKADSVVADLRERPVEDPHANEAQFQQALAVLRQLPVGSAAAASAALASRAEVLPCRLGEYELLAWLGGGGMGDVYKARHVRLERIVAIKVLAGAWLGDKDAVARFHREMRAMGQLAHPNIVTAHDAGEYEGRHFLVMEYIEGEDLAKLVKRSGPLPVRQACEYLLQAARGLASAHGKGIIHRDIKPSNLIVDGTGTIRILDLGLARFDATSAAMADGLTMVGQVMGTPAFMAPEQTQDTSLADARSDLYSLGCTLYYLLTGQALYSTGTAMYRLYAHRELPIPSLREACPEAPLELERILTRLVAKRPEERYADAGELVRALEGCSHHGPRDEMVEQGHRVMPPALPHAEREAYTRRQRLLVAGALAGCTLLAGIIVIVRNQQGKEVGRIQVPDGGSVSVVGEPPPDSGKPVEAAPSAMAPFDALRREQIPGDELKAAGGGDAAKAPQELVAILGDSRLHHHAGANCVAFSPVGGLIASGSIDHSVRVWDAAKGRLALPALLVGTGYAIAFSPDGAKLAVASGVSMIHVRDASDGRPLFNLEGHTDWVSSVAFRPDGKQMASASMDRTVRLWDAETGQLIKTFPPQAAPLHSVAYSADGQWLITGAADGNCERPNAARGVKVVSTATQEQVLELEDAEKAGWCVAADPKGKHFAGGADDGTVRIWDARTGRMVHLLECHKSGVKALAFSPDGGRLATASHDGTAAVWDVATGRRLATTGTHNWLRVTGVAFSPDGATLATTESYGPVRLWNADTGRPLHPDWSTPGTMTAALASPDGRLLATSSEDGSVRFWDFGGPAPVVRGGPAVHGTLVRTLTFSPSGQRLASGTDDGHLTMWDPVDGQKLSQRRGHTGAIDRVTFSPDGRRLATASVDGASKLWDAASGDELRSFPSRKDNPPDVAFLAGGKLLAGITASNHIQVWDIATGNVVRTLESPQTIFRITASPDGSHLAAGTEDGEIVVWDTATGGKTATLSGHTRSVESVAFSPDGRQIASASLDGTIRLCDVETGEPLRAIRLFEGQGHSNYFRAAFSPDGRHLITANGNGTVYILRLATSE